MTEREYRDLRQRLSTAAQSRDPNVIRLALNDVPTSSQWGQVLHLRGEAFIAFNARDFARAIELVDHAAEIYRSLDDREGELVFSSGISTASPTVTLPFSSAPLSTEIFLAKILPNILARPAMCR